jgi:ligand-binding sensor domain-containing protein
LQFSFFNPLAWAVRPYTPVHPDPVLEPWRWRSFPELKGLGLRCIAEAKDRAIWFGVEDGVRRYDGVKWMAFTEAEGILGSPVVALLGARDGGVYAGTPLGISRFRDGKWSRAFPPEGNLPWMVNDLLEARDGSLWAGTGWGALHLGREGATLYTTEDRGAALRALMPGLRVSIVPDEAASVRSWNDLGTRTGWIGSGVRDFFGTIVFALAPGGPGERAGLKVGDRITAQKTSGNSRRLTVRREGRPDPFEVSVSSQKVEGGIRDFMVYDVCEDRQERFWFGLGGGEVVCYTPSTQHSTLSTQHSQWRLYTEKDGLVVREPLKITRTRDGAIWAGDDDSDMGLRRFDGKTWTHYRLSDIGGSNYNNALLETQDGSLWVGGIGLLHALRNGVWTIYRSPQTPIPKTRVRSLVEASDGALWMAGLGREAVRLDFGTARWTTYTGLNFQCETPDGTQWFVSQDDGVVCYDGQRWTRYGVEDGLMDAPLGLIATRQGVLWAFGSHDSTAATARLEGMRWSLQTHPRLDWGILPTGPIQG